MAQPLDNRVDWVDAAKGLCILMVVLMHSTLGVEKQLGELTWMHHAVDWARPFRMPDFFLISGLFLSARIDKPWRSYADTRVLHFAYFYLLWFHIHFLLRIQGTIGEAGPEGALGQYLLGYVNPYSAIWFIYMLALYGVLTRLLRGVPKPLVLATATAAHMLWPPTGIFLFDEFADRFVYFYAGYAGAPLVFAYARGLSRRSPALLAVGLLGWGVLNGLAVATGISQWTGIDMIVSGLGIGAVIAFSVMVTSAQPGPAASLRSWLAMGLLYAGRNSIVIYLAFTLFMASTRSLLLKLAPGLDGGLMALACAAAGIGGALGMHLLVRGTRAGFLFERPDWARLSVARPKPRARLRARPPRIVAAR